MGHFFCPPRERVRAHQPVRGVSYRCYGHIRQSWFVIQSVKCQSGLFWSSAPVLLSYCSQGRKRLQIPMYNVAGVNNLSMYFNTHYYRYSMIAAFVWPIKSIRNLSAIHIYYCQTLIMHAIYQLIQLINSNCISMSLELQPFKWA